MIFPKDFVWGAATDAYQIEGAVREDGRGETVWDRFCHSPGRTRNGETGDVACDHYHRYREDVALMKEIGLQGYRLSMAWSRLFPEGTGRLNPKGLDFYQRLVDELLKNQITPYITLFHWDLPQALQEKGGFASRDMALYFRDYAVAAVTALGDRVKKWMTLNEPTAYSWAGHFDGIHAPGIRDLKTCFAVSHCQLLAHGEAVRAMRSVRNDLSISIALNTGWKHPASADPKDIEATALMSDFFEGWYLDAIYKARYPQRILDTFKEYLPEIRDGDLSTISAPMDWLGINNYSRLVTAADETSQLKAKYLRVEGVEHTDYDWEVYPQGLYTLLTTIYDNYGKPDIVVTENGAAYGDGPDAEGRVRDDRRIKFLNAYIAAAGRAMEAGVRLKGYFVWTLMDNFEWNEGYSKRFGLVHVDFKTQKRTMKDSGRWYHELIATNGGSLKKEQR